MKHKVNLELSIEDDEFIAQAERQATDELVKALKNEIFDRRYSWSKNSTELSDKATAIIKGWLNENKEILYERIADKIAASMLRSAKFRDILEGKIKNGDADG